MPAITFYHPDIPSSNDGDRPGPYLHISTGVDEVSWGYNLNTVAFPTYGGEVVQILSCYIDDLTVVGTVGSYREMERIYAYFAYYLQIATQGRATSAQPGITSYNQRPIQMTYPERGWSFNIIVTALPGFRRSVDTVAPNWRIQAHIVDHSEDLHDIKEFTQQHVLAEFLRNDGEKFDIEGRIGFQAENPFSAIGSVFGDTFDPNVTRDEWRRTANRFNEVIEAYLDSDLDALYEAMASRPTSGLTQGDRNVERGRQETKEAKERRG